MVVAVVGDTASARLRTFSVALTVALRASRTVNTTGVATVGLLIAVTVKRPSESTPIGLGTIEGWLDVTV